MVPYESQAFIRLYRETLEDYENQYFHYCSRQYASLCIRQLCPIQKDGCKD